MAPIAVFISYVDCYVGRQMLRQFDGKQHLFTIYGCTWTESAAENLNKEAMGARQHDSLSMLSGPHTLNVTAATVGTMRNGVVEGSTADSGLGTSALLTRDVEGLSTVPDGERGVPPAVVPVAESERVPDKTVLGGLPHFFCRSDVHAVRNALIACDWIIVMQRQSRDVFDFLHVLQQNPFIRPKRFVLLSNFMTWFATPPLTLPEGAGEEEEGEPSQSDEDEDINAPYPLPTDENEMDEESVLDDVAMSEGKEILTEDQFNRRIPHVKYYNWRDAEKAVASAHHANGLPLDTFVIFSGLPYGDGEEVLQPLFRQAWCAEEGSLPIFGEGNQSIPMIHVCDLAVFTRKLLRCPLDELPNPSVRYLFATDDSRLTWRRVIETINKAFGDRKTLDVIPKEEFMLHDNVEFFTVDLRVENESIRGIMEREDAIDQDEGTIAGNGLFKEDGGGRSGWVAQEGFAKNIERVSLEFRHAHRLTPLRVVILGPPMAGKTYLSTKLSYAYRLPRFTMDEVVEAFKACLNEYRRELTQCRENMLRSEVERRTHIKRRRLLHFKQRAKSEDEEVEDYGADGELLAHSSVRGRHSVLSAAPQSPSVRDESNDDVEEREEHEFVLTQQEVEDVEEWVGQRFESNSHVEEVRERIAEMERVLLMRVRERPSSPDVNPKRRASQGKKKLTKEQQRKKEEEELQRTKEALKDAPFQDKGLALMLRWRLAQPDCLNQGFILDGFPETVEQGRLCFGSTPLDIPSTEEEALAPPPAPPAAPEHDSEDSVHPMELSDEQRLPDHVVVLEAPRNYLLDRLTAVCRLREPKERVIGKGLNDSALTEGVFFEDGQEHSALEQFYAKMTTFEEQYVDTDYSLLNFFECAETVPGVITVGARRVSVHSLNVAGTEPAVPPDPPVSAYEEVPKSAAEVELHCILGSPHNLGETPFDFHQDVFRRQQLETEKKQTEQQEVEAQRRREVETVSAERGVRQTNEAILAKVKEADYAALEERKAPLREYLLKNVMPLLSRGLIEVCRRHPEDPVDYLAEWLLQHNPHDDVFCDL